VAKRDHREEADDPGHDHRGLDDARRDVADRDARVVQLADAVERDGGADVADHGQDLEERAERDLPVVPGAEDVAVVVEHRAVEEHGGYREDERADEEPPDDARRPLVCCRHC
jgi:hypothetical protein